MTDIPPLIDPEPGVWTQVADHAQIADQHTGAARPFALAVKANIAVRGFRRSAGCAALDEVAEEADASVVSRLRDLGAVVVGNTNMHELAFGITSNNASYGAVRNPIDPGRSAGGSSGGSAAAVARGDVPLALGTDTGGSVSIPAALCGVVGFRPSTGRWPGDGVVGLSWTRDTPGLFARSVADIARVDSAVCEVTAAEPATRLGRIGVPRQLIEALAPHTRVAFQTAMDHLRTVFEVTEVDLAAVLAPLNAAERPVALWEAPRLLGDAAARAFDLAPDLAFRRLVGEVRSPDVAAALRAALEDPVSAEDYAQSRARIWTARERYAELLARHELDALVFPTTPAPAPAIGDDETVAHLGRRVSTFGLYTRNTGQGTLLGAPMLTIPAPVAAGALPVGMTFQGARFDDRRVLALAAQAAGVLSGSE